MKPKGSPVAALGYGGALVLTAIALAILIDTFVQGRAPGRPGPAAAGARQTSTAPDAVTQPSIEPSVPRAEPTRPSITRRPVVRNPAVGNSGVARCSPRSAVYERSGDTVKVTVDFRGNGYVAAFVELAGRDTMTKSATNTGRPQSFLFTGVPESITRRIGVTVITQTRMQTCEVPRKR